MSHTPRTDAAFAEHGKITLQREQYVMAEFAQELERENAALNHKLDEILTNKNYEGGVQFWINKHDEVLLREASLLAENAALLKDVCDLVHKNELLREDKERLDWVIKDSYYHFFFKLSSDLEKGRRQIDAARKEAQP